MKKLADTIYGIGVCCLVFTIFTFVVAEISSFADTGLLREKVDEAFRTSDIQYPGVSSVSDPRGIDTFTDCIAIDIAILNSGSSLKGKFDSFDSFVPPYAARGLHTCDGLFDVINQRPGSNIKLYNYNAYWWGFCGLGENCAWTDAVVSGPVQSTCAYAFVCKPCGIHSLLFFTPTDAVALCTLRYSFPSCSDSECLIMGQSIAHAPGFIVGAADAVGILFV